MQKKPGQISSNTLGLRFMQNAAKARQEREMQAAKARVRSEEEWELAPEVREGWGPPDGEGSGGGQTVSYEPSYLPFLFPGLSSASRPTAPVANGNAAASPDDSHASESDDEEASGVVYKGRRKFGQHGREEAEDKPAPAQPLPPAHDAILPRGARSISSHGRGAAAAVSTSSPSSSKPPPLPPSHPPPHHALAAPRSFMKPPVDAPRAQKRRNGEAGPATPALAHGDHTTDGAESGARTMKKTRKQ